MTHIPKPPSLMATLAAANRKRARHGYPPLVASEDALLINHYTGRIIWPPKLAEPAPPSWVERLTALLARIFKRRRVDGRVYPSDTIHQDDANIRPRNSDLSWGTPTPSDGGTMVVPEPSAEAIEDAIAEARAAEVSDRLSQHFKLSEFTASDTAKRFGLDNTPPDEALANLYLAAAGMERVRNILGGKPIIVTSGYRSPKVNAKVGSHPGSAHCLGWAVDFKCPSVGKPADIVRILKHAHAGGGLEFDQLINEFDAWVHISFDPRARGEVFRIG